jgi:hypothetical protein
VSHHVGSDLCYWIVTDSGQAGCIKDICGTCDSRGLLE